jgi:RNA polymerase sigma factor (sigma-70 family)
MMNNSSSRTGWGSATKLLIDWSNGSESAREKLFEMLYSELLVVAKRRARPDQTLQPADLVHALWERLIDIPTLDLSNVARPSRAYFFSLAMRVMSDRVCDYLRKKYANKRTAVKVPLDDVLSEQVAMGREAGSGEMIRASENKLIELILREEFRTCLDRLPDRQRAVLDARIAGLTLEETAEWVGVSPATVKRDQAVAEARLRLCLGVRPNVA